MLDIFACIGSERLMNLIDAIKSARPFRRKGKGGGGFWFVSTEPSFATVDIIADDWEIQEPTVMITTRQFWDAFDLVVSEAKGFGMAPVTVAEGLARKLGLEP